MKRQSPRRSFALDRERDRKLEDLARRRGTSVSEILREAVDDVLRKAIDHSSDPAFKSLNIQCEPLEPGKDFDDYINDDELP